METIKYYEHTYQSFYNDAKMRECVDKSRCRSRAKTQKEWFGTANFSEAFNYAQGGWDAGLKQLDITDGETARGGMELRQSVAGAIPNVQNYLQGLPLQMYEYVNPNDYNTETLDIFVPLCYASSVSGAKALRFTQSIVTLVNAIQSKYDVRLIGIVDASHDDYRSIDRIIIKERGERFVLNNVAFAFHPSFFRRIWFAHAETRDYIDYGYGRPNDTVKQWKENDKLVGRDKALYIPQIEDAGDGNGRFKYEDCKEVNF